MSASWPETLRTMAFVFAQAMSADQLKEFYFSSELVLLLGEELKADIGLGNFDDLAESMAEEYTRLFVGPYNHFPPTEGLARGDGQLIGDHAISVQRAYAEAGFEVEPNTGLLPDHIGIELDFVANLIEWEKWDSAREFVRTHPLSWVPNWVSAFTDEARFQIYPAVGNALCACLREIVE